MTGPVRLIGVPMDLGADRRGVDMGPSAIRYAGLTDELESVGVDCVDDGDITVPGPEQDNPDAYPESDRHAKYLDETATVCRALADRVSDAVGDGHLPLVIGGDHSIAVGTAGGAARSDETGILWFDAHGDFNTPSTTPSGNVHGMPLAALLGLGEFADMDWAQAPNVREENVAMIGLRSLQDAEREEIRDSDVTAFTMADIDQRGITDVTSEAMDIATHGVDDVHLSFDMDLVDPNEAPGVGTPVRGGISYREAHAAMESVARNGIESLSSLEFVEVNPILDEHNRTAELAVELAGSVLGKSVL
jgi:arginase